MPPSPVYGTYTQLFNEGMKSFGLTPLQATHYAGIVGALGVAKDGQPNSQRLSDQLLNTYMNLLYEDPRLTAEQVQQILDAVGQKTEVKIPNTLAPKPRSGVDELDLVAFTDEDFETDQEASFVMNMVGGPQPIGTIAGWETQVRDIAAFAGTFSPPARDWDDQANGGIFGRGRDDASQAPPQPPDEPEGPGPGPDF